jgi:isoleucyl-tRNA synthetase
MIWTTTPWTLPANVAIAAHPELEYAGVRYRDPASGRTVHTILAAELVARVMALRHVAEYAEVGRVRGKDIEHSEYRHPFVERISPIVLAAYVSVEDGTGLVHTAPGHGAEDYQTGQKYQLETLSPVDPGGKFDQSAPDWLQGKMVFTANPEIIAALRDSGHLYHEASFVHSYPHCWRCKKPVIFRATEQWFVGVDKNDLRGRTLKQIEEVRWLPEWGRNRIEAMVSLRPDWCISRQRSWGVPIPVFQCLTCQEGLMTAEIVRHVRDLVRSHGADIWYEWETELLLPAGAACPHCGGRDFGREVDILDVWFESGSSHRAVLDEPSYGLGGSPAFLYLEGSDQHRGWFQSSILTAVGSTGRAPFETVLTHGFVVDDKGEKMSKSVGNTISAVKATEQYGADVLRLYVASMDYSDDIRMSERGIKEMSEAYRKIRNTFRYLLGNLEDYAGFDPATVPADTLHEIDRWALGQLNQVIRDVRSAYERFEFYRVYQRVYQFCAVELSSFYLDVLKDRLYAELADGPDRRAAQFVLARLHEGLTRLLAPIIPHTAEDLWDFVPAAPGKPASVHLAEWPEPDPAWDDPALEERWARLREVREHLYRSLEEGRRAKVFGSGMEARISYQVNPADAVAFERDRDLLMTLCIISELEIIASEDIAPGALGVAVATRSPHPKCERCWNLRPTVGQNAEHPTLCDRCARVISERNDGAALAGDPEAR